jgi:hypothetical protein
MHDYLDSKEYYVKQSTRVICDHKLESACFGETPTPNLGTCNVISWFYQSLLFSNGVKLLPLR